MVHFVIRVVLQDAVPEDYERLNLLMMFAGFVRVDQADDGRLYHLPPAEYHTSGRFAGEQVREAAGAAASQTGRAVTVMVHEYTKWWALNLRPWGHRNDAVG